MIGPNAAEGRIGGGGSSYVVPPYRTSPLEALKARLEGNLQIVYAKGCDNDINLPVVPSAWLELPQGGGNGLWGEYFTTMNMDGSPVYSGQDDWLDFWWFVDTTGSAKSQRNSGRWTGILRVPESSSYRIRLTNSGNCRIFLNDELVLENIADNSANHAIGVGSSEVILALTAGQPYSLRIEFIRHMNQNFAHWRMAMSYWHDPATDHRLEQAVEAARRCDAAIIFAGMPEQY